MFKWLFGRTDDEPGGLSTGSGEVIVVSRKIAAPPATVFDAFVSQFDTWWPRERRVASGQLHIDPRFGGRLTEGAETVGSVLSFHRPEHIVIAWQIGPGGRLEPSEGSASRIDVRFVPVDGRATEVVVVHRDFARHGDGWQAYHAEMRGKNGWPAIADAFAKAASAAS
jgi:uncharacterized protein YndB with AHSA1/START domain